MRTRSGALVIGTQSTRLADERLHRGISARDLFGDVVVTAPGPALGYGWLTQ
jgi:hypothetical protein